VPVFYGNIPNLTSFADFISFVISEEAYEISEMLDPQIKLNTLLHMEP